MPVFRTKKEPFDWLIEGKKTIDVRRGKPIGGEVAIYVSGKRILRRQITKMETGKLSELVRADNFRQVIPSAKDLDEARAYFCGLYGSCEGVFTAYYVLP